MPGIKNRKASAVTEALRSSRNWWLRIVFSMDGHKLLDFLSDAVS